MSEDKKIKRKWRPSIARTPNKIESDGLQREEFLTRLRKHDSVTTFDDSALWAEIEKIKESLTAVDTTIVSATTALPDEVKEMLSADGDYIIGLRGRISIAAPADSSTFLIIKASLLGSTSAVGSLIGANDVIFVTSSTTNFSVSSAGIITASLAVSGNARNIFEAFATVRVTNGVITTLDFNSNAQTINTGTDKSASMCGASTQNINTPIGNNILFWTSSGSITEMLVRMHIEKI